MTSQNSKKLKKLTSQTNLRWWTHGEKTWGRKWGCVAIIVDSGADVALFPLSMADHGEGALQFSTKTKLQNAQGSCIPKEARKVLKFPCAPWWTRSSSQVECGLQFQGESAHTLLWKVDGTWLGNQQQRAHAGEWWVIRDEDENCLEAQVPEALEKESGSLLTSKFVDPTVIPKVEESLELMRTTSWKEEVHG